MTDTLEKTDTDVKEAILPYDEPNPENFTHIINPPANTHIWKPGMNSQDIVDIARATGQTVTALCGKTWVPSRNPEQHPACDTCIEIAGELMRSNGE